MRAIDSLYEWLDLRRLGFIGLFLSLMMFITLSDPDYFWHFQTGKYLFEHRALPAGDVFSFTHAGQPWVLHEWLFELMLYGVYTLLGPLGVKFMTAVFAVVTMIVAYRTAKPVLGKPYPAFFLTLAYFTPILIGISPRPQLVTFLFFAVFLYVLMAFKYRHVTRILWLPPLLMIIWVNAHGGYVVGVALLLLFTACEWLIFLFRQNADLQHKRRLVLLTLATGATILASLVNPYFVSHWYYPFQLMRMASTQGIISEWQSPNFHTLPHQVYLVLVCVTFVAAMYRKVRPDLTEIALALFFVMASFVAVRHIPLAAIVLISFAAVSLSQSVIGELLAQPLERAKKAYSKFAHDGGDLGRTEFALNWVLLVIITAGCLLYYPVRQAGQADNINKMIPVKATQFIMQAGIQGRVFNTYHYGGYLIHNLYPKQKVFIDGRNDMYGDAFMNEYVQIDNGQAGWEKLFDRYNIDYVLVQRDTPLRQLLLMRGDFKLVYDDQVNSILLKNSDRYAAIIDKYAH